MADPRAAPGAAHLTPGDALRRLPQPDGSQSIVLFEHGTLQVKMYAPRGTDPQQPHDRDELYAVVRGSGKFFDGETRRPFEAGDLIFVEAHRPHRFEDFSDDLAVWVMFYGPPGGEQSPPRP